MANLNVKEGVAVLAVLPVAIRFAWAFIAWLVWASIAFILPKRLYGNRA